MQSMLEDIKKKEKLLNDKKEKLFTSKDHAQWDLGKLTLDEVSNYLKDKPKCLNMMLPKENQVITDMKDLFSVIVQNFKYEVSKAEDWTYLEMRDHLVNVSEPIMQSYHNHLMIWNQFDQKIKQTL